MNMIGKFGQLMMNYQHPIQISLIAILALLVIVFLIRAAVNAKKKKELLSEINRTVSEISSTVTSLNEKKTEVVYIDNRVPAAPAYPQPAAYAEPQTSAAEAEAAPAEEPKTDAEPAAEPAEEKQTVTRFFDRDCAVSKTGRTYSIEELQNQIKE